MIPDCRTCGLCCCAPVYHDGSRALGYVEVTPKEAGLLGRLVRHVLSKLAMRQRKDGRCQALAGTVGTACSCSVYENRPAPCREMEPGGEHCRAIRAFWGDAKGPRRMVPRPEGWAP